MRGEHIICPYCNHVHIKSVEIVFVRAKTCRCNECGEIFKVRHEVVRTWFTEKVDP